MTQKNLFTKQKQTQTQRRNLWLWWWGEWEGGLHWEFRTDMNTLLYLK